MILEFGDITPKQAFNICMDFRDCQKCPLYVPISGTNYKDCIQKLYLISGGEYLHLIVNVDVPEKYLEKEKK